jgi:hypothetical protein
MTVNGDPWKKMIFNRTINVHTQDAPFYLTLLALFAFFPARNYSMDVAKMIS